MKTIKVGVIGLGEIAQLVHLPILAISKWLSQILIRKAGSPAPVYTAKDTDASVIIQENKGMQG